MTIDKDAKRKAAELNKLLLARLVDEGYKNVRQFHMESKIPLSPETVRRAFGDVDYYKAMEESTLIMVCTHLNYRADEIRDILVKYTDDKYFHKIIGKQPANTLSPLDDAVTKAMSDIIKVNPGSVKLLADMLDFLAMGSGIDVTVHTDKIRRRKAA